MQGPAIRPDVVFTQQDPLVFRCLFRERRVGDKGSITKLPEQLTTSDKLGRENLILPMERHCLPFPFAAPFGSLTLLVPFGRTRLVVQRESRFYR